MREVPPLLLSGLRPFHPRDSTLLPWLCQHVGGFTGASSPHVLAVTSTVTFTVTFTLTFSPMRLYTPAPAVPACRGLHWCLISPCPSSHFHSDLHLDHHLDLHCDLGCFSVFFCFMGDKACTGWVSVSKACLLVCLTFDLTCYGRAEIQDIHVPLNLACHLPLLILLQRFQLHLWGSPFWVRCVRM